MDKKKSEKDEQNTLLPPLTVTHCFGNLICGTISIAAKNKEDELKTKELKTKEFKKFPRIGDVVLVKDTLSSIANLWSFAKVMGFDFYSQTVSLMSIRNKFRCVANLKDVICEEFNNWHLGQEVGISQDKVRQLQLRIESLQSKGCTSLSNGEIVLAHYDGKYWLAKLIGYHNTHFRVVYFSFGRIAYTDCICRIGKSEKTLHIKLGKLSTYRKDSAILLEWITKHLQNVCKLKSETKKDEKEEKKTIKTEKTEKKEELRVGDVILAEWRQKYWMATITSLPKQDNGNYGLRFIGDDCVGFQRSNTLKPIGTRGLHIANWKFQTWKGEWRLSLENMMYKQITTHLNKIHANKIHTMKLSEKKKNDKENEDKTKQILPNLKGISDHILAAQQFISKLSDETVTYETALTAESQTIITQVQQHIDNADFFKAYEILKPVVSTLEDAKFQDMLGHLSKPLSKLITPTINKDKDNKVSWSFMSDFEQCIRESEQSQLMGDKEAPQGLTEFKSLFDDLSVRLKSMSCILEEYPLDQFYERTNVLFWDLVDRAKTLFFAKSLTQIKRKCNLVQEMCYKQAELESLSQFCLQAKQLEKYCSMEKLFQNNIQDMWIHMKNLRKTISVFLNDSTCFITADLEKKYKEPDSCLDHFLTQQEKERLPEIKNVLTLAEYLFGEFFPEKKRQLESDIKKEVLEYENLFSNLNPRLDQTVLESANLACQSYSKSKRLGLLLTKYMPLYQTILKGIIKNHVTQLENYKSYLSSMFSVLCLRDQIVSLLLLYIKNRTVDYNHQVTAHVNSMEILSCTFYNKRLKSLATQEKQLKNRNRLKIKRISEFKVVMQEALEAADETIYLEFVQKIEHDQKDQTQIVKSLEEVSVSILETTKDVLFKELCENHKIQPLFPATEQKSSAIIVPPPPPSSSPSLPPLEDVVEENSSKCSPPIPPKSPTDFVVVNDDHL